MAALFPRVLAGEGRCVPVCWDEEFLHVFGVPAAQGTPGTVVFNRERPTLEFSEHKVILNM